MRDRTATAAAAAAARSNHRQHQHHHKVQHVYSLDVEALSDRLGVSQKELVDGIAKEHSHVALQAMLESVAAHDDSSSSEDEDNGDGAAICRQACLLLLPSRNAHQSSKSKHERFAPLLSLEDGRTVLEHILHALFQTKILSHLVVCVPTTLRGTDLHATVAKITSRLGASAKVRVQVIDADEADGEVHALQCAAKRLTDASQQTTRSGNSNNSAGLLVLNCDRIFDAPTIRMMAVSARSSAQSSDGLDRSVRVRALVDLDVELISDADNNNNSEESDAPTHFAGIFAFMGDAAATAAVLEQHVSSAQQALQCSTLSELVRAIGSASDERMDYQDVSSRAVLEKVVASDYCSWRRVDRTRDTKEQQPIERHSTSAFHSQRTKSSSSKNKIDVRSHRFSLSPTSPSSKQQHQAARRASDCEYFEFPREPHLFASHGYQGFKVDTKVVAAREPELASRQHKGQSTSEAKPLLGERSSRSYSESSQQLERTGTEATTLTEADLDALLDTKNRAFLFQIGPDTAQPFDSSVTPRAGHDGQRAQDVDDDDGLFLAIPDVVSPDNCVFPNVSSHMSDPFTFEPDHQQLPRRHRSVQLPSAVQEIKVEAIVQLPSAHVRGGNTVAVNVVVKTQVPVIGYAILITAVVAISSQGAVQDLLVGVPPLLKVFWRMTGASMAFAPLALRPLAQSNWTLPTLTPRKRALFALCGVSYAIYNATFIVALSLTSVGHTYIFSNCHSLLMVLAKLVLGQPLGALELVGAAIGFSGGVITTMDHHSASETAAATTPLLRHGPSTLGDMIALAGAFAGVAYLMSAKRVRPTLGVFVFMWALVTTVAVLVLFVLLWNREALGVLVASTDDTHGLFGWLHHLGIEAYVVLVGSFAGTMGFVTALKYFDPLVVSVTMLTEPVVATIIGIAIGVDQVPGPLTFLGGLAVVVGCMLVLLASHRTCTRVDVSDALEEPATAAWKLSNSVSSSRRRHSTVHARDLQQQQQQPPSLRVNYGSFP